MTSSSILQSHIRHQKIKIKVKPGAPIWKVECVYGENLNRLLVCLFQKLSPALLEELPHVMTSSTNVWIVFIEFFAVIKDQVNINDESLQILIPEIKKKSQREKAQLTYSWYITYCGVTINVFSEKHYSDFKFCAKTTKRSDGDLLAAHKLLTYGGEVHRFLDDLPVARDRFLVDGCEKRPCILMPLQLSKEYPVEHTNTQIHTHG